VIKFKDPASFAVPEPRIHHIARQLERLLSLVQLEKDGQPVEVNGFRLRDLADWQTYTTNTAMNALTPISGLCNSKCHFCFEEGVPFAREQSLMSVAEARTRLKYYSPETGKCLFPSNRNHMETFVHPQALEIIELARRREPGKLFWITSNGSHFCESTVARLAALKPLIFKLSLNVADPGLNRGLMRTGKRTETALAAPRLLRQYRIPFMGSIVAWPSLPLVAVEDTARYLDECQAYAIRIRLPLTHKYLKTQLDCDFHAHWERVAAFAHGLRPRLAAPLFVEPPIYWVNPIVPEVDGVILSSPAHRAGVRAGDVVRSVNGRPVATRIQSEAALDQCHLAREPAVDLVVDRRGERLAFRLEEAPAGVDTYPYSSDYFYRGENYGVFHVEDFHLKYVQQMFDVIRRFEAREVLLFTSSIVAPIFETLVNHIPEFAAQLRDVNLYVETVKDNTLGGNYDLMDSRFVEDYARVIRRRLAQGVKPDLVLLPDAFGSPWGVDVVGGSCTRISMEFGIPAERLDWYLIYGREV
jgi:hypothetical protein